jgi:hypothetical protein
VGTLTNVESNQRRFAPTPAHIHRNHLPTSLEYAGKERGKILRQPQKGSPIIGLVGDCLQLRTKHLFALA